MASPAGRFLLMATVPTGLERCAAEECSEVVGRGVVAHRGAITCTLDTVEDLAKFDQLRSIDNYRAVVGTLSNFCKEESTVFERLESLPGLLDWTSALRLWQYHRNHIECFGSSLSQAASDRGEEVGDKLSTCGVDRDEKRETVRDTASEAERESAVGEETNDDGKRRPECSLLKKEGITFRVTCTRSGRKHSFSSPDAARVLGAGLVQFTNWTVQLKNPDIEVLLGIHGDEARVGVALNREAKFKRNITHFGPTTLRATIAYGMLRCADIQPGDVVLDPLCGGGTISIEGSLGWRETCHIAGDIHHLAVPRASSNVQSILQQTEHEKHCHLKVEVCQWDVCHLPLRSSTVDVVVTDMPFGKKSGSRLANWELYPKALREMARVCRSHTARAVLLTHDHKALSKALQRDIFWKRVKTLWVNVGGLEAALYILHRSSRLCD